MTPDYCQNNECGKWRVGRRGECRPNSCLGCHSLERTRTGGGVCGCPFRCDAAGTPVTAVMAEDTNPARNPLEGRAHGLQNTIIGDPDYKPAYVYQARRADGSVESIPRERFLDLMTAHYARDPNAPDAATIRATLEEDYPA
jgi:hypothetical protein